MSTTSTLLDAVGNVTATSTTLVEKSQIVEFINAALSIRFHHSPVLLLIPLAWLILAVYIFRSGFDRNKVWFFASRIVLFTLVLLAISSPVLMQTQTEVSDFPEVKILLDESPSMALYGNNSGKVASDLMDSLIGSVTNVTGAKDKVSMDVISSTSETSIGDELYRLMTTSDEGSIIVLFSDGNNNAGRRPTDVARQLGKSNTTIYTVALNQEAEDVYVESIIGESKITSNRDYEVKIKVRTTSTPVNYKMTILVDGLKITDLQIMQDTLVKEIPARFSFNSVGVHSVTAQILSSEKNTIKANDVFIKTVEVVDKPEVLLVTNNTNSPLKAVLDEVYDLDMSDRIPGNVHNYNAVYLDDISVSMISSAKVEDMREYILNGNGLVVVGGGNSYDYGGYNNSHFETLLPVISMEKPKEKRKSIAVLILMDISASTEYGISDAYKKTTKIDFEKALAIKILRSLDVNDSVGVIAFNTIPYVIAPLERLGERKMDIEDKIRRLNFGGGTDMLTTLDSAENLLKYYAINKYVILLSDGVIRTSRIPTTVEKARELSTEGIRVYSVGVGFDTDENFMRAVADAGKGAYFKPEAYQRLNIEFGRGLEEDEEGKYVVDVRDEYHFITRNTNVSALISDYNRVSEKSVAQLLLTTKGGSPVLTVWNFGLGRVASLTTDNGREWAGNVYQRDNSKLISTITNWVIGDLEKNKDTRVRTEDIHLGQDAIVVVDSVKRPVVTIEKNENQLAELEMKTVGLHKYSTELDLNETGFYSILARSQEGADRSGIAINYPKEYTELTADLDELSSIARASNGRLYYESEMDQLKEEIIQEMQRMSVKSTIRERELYLVLIILALLFYFIDTIARRINDIRRLKKT